VLLRYLEQKLTFKPTDTDYGGLPALGVSRFRFGRDFGLDLDGAFMDRGSRQAVLFIHGNKHNLTRFSDHYALFAALGLSCMCFDYPGYGQSSGAPSEEALYASARAAYAFATGELGRSPADLIVYGCSMGGAVAIELLQDRPAAALITESTFTNSWDMAQHLYPYRPVGPLLPKRFRNDEKASRITVPMLIIHGANDPVVPASMAQKLFDTVSSPKELVIVPGANHIDSLTRGGEKLQDTIRKFIATHTSR